MMKGYDEDFAETSTPSPKKAKFLPVRSGPTQHRQSAQKTTTESPKVWMISTVKTKKDTDTKKDNETLVTSEETLIGVPTKSSAGENVLTGNTPAPDDFVPQTSTVGVKDAFLGVPDMDNLLLPVLRFSKEPTTAAIINQTLDTTTEPSHDITTTGDEMDVADALLSLSNILSIEQNPDDDFELDDNSLLMPIGGQAVCEDIAPTESRLGQIEVDHEIAHIIDSKEQTSLSVQTPSTSLLGIQNTGPVTLEPIKSSKIQPLLQTPLIGVPPQDTSEQAPVIVEQSDNTKDIDKTSALSGVQKGDQALDDDTEKLPEPSTGARPKTIGTLAQPGFKGSRGSFKSQLYGLRRKVPKDRAYKCGVCGKSKRSIEELNEHHHNRHDPQKCGICGKVFDLATTLAHHMYSHYKRKYQCEKCQCHCFFKSELESHMIVHRETPTHQCQYPKCGKWFKRKGELALHVEIHNKTWYDCDKCDFSTKLLKYLK